MTGSEPDDVITARRRGFRDLHEAGVFVLPNAWDVGSARLLAHLGFPALATTSSGHAAALGRLDQHVTLQELLTHVTELAAATVLPLNVDAERCFADDPAGIGEVVDRLAATGASGCSIEDYDPATGRIDALDVAVDRVAAAASAAHRHGLVLTARAENHLYGVHDLDDTIARLRAYRDAGADVVYAPGSTDLAEIGRIVEAADGTPVNVLLRSGGPTVAELAEVGVRRVSTGGALAFAAYGTLVSTARDLLDAGHAPDDAARLDPILAEEAFGRHA